MGDGLLDLERQFTIYTAHHSNSVNSLIHTLFVWPNFFTTLLYFTPQLLPVPASLASSLPYGLSDIVVLNLGATLALLYALFCISLDARAGSFAALLCGAFWVSSSVVAYKIGFALGWKVVLASQLFCSITQLVGHKIFEKRSLSIVDNFAQAFIMPPFFVLLENLENFFGYEPYPGFCASVQAKVEADLKKWNAEKQKKSS